MPGPSRGVYPNSDSSPTGDLRGAAESYAERGWSAIPLRQRSKAAGIPWTEYQDYCPTAEEIARWDWPGVGIVTGRVSALVVLDADGEEGVEELRRRGHPVTPMVRTGSGGLHLYFKHPGGRLSSSVRFAPGLDLKGDGGLVVAPPSLHPNGRPYEWIAGLSPAETSLAELPEWVVSELRTGFARRARAGDVVADVLEGSRNSTLISVAGALRRGGMDEATIAAVLIGVNETRCRPPLGEDEVRRIAWSVSRYQPYRYGTLKKDGNGIAGERGEEGEQLTVTSVSLADVPERGPREEVLGGLITKGWPAILYGPGGVVKSMKALSLGQAIADPEMGQWLGREVITCPVVYLDFELDAEEQSRRAHRIARGNGRDAPPRDLRYMTTFGIPRRLRKNVLQNALNECVKHGAGVIFIDSVGLALGGDPGGFEDVVGWFEEEIISFLGAGITPIAIDHTRRLQPGERSQSLGVYGSIYKEHLSRTLIQVEHVSRDRKEHSLITRLRPKKSNFSELAEPIEIKTTFSEEMIAMWAVEIEDVDRAGEETLNAKDRVISALRSVDEAGPDEITEICQTLERSTIRKILSELRGEGIVEDTGNLEGRARKVRLVIDTDPHKGR